MGNKIFNKWDKLHKFDRCALMNILYVDYLTEINKTVINEDEKNKFIEKTIVMIKHLKENNKIEDNKDIEKKMINDFITKDYYKVRPNEKK